MAQFSANNLPTNLLSQPIPMQKGARAYVGGRSLLDNIYGQSSNPSIQANPPSRFIPNLFPIDHSKRNFSALNLSPLQKQNIINESYTRNNLPIPTSPISNQKMMEMANVRKVPSLAPSNQQMMEMANVRGQTSQGNVRQDATPPNLKNNLLNYLVSPHGKGMAQGLLEASGYSKTPVTLGQAVAMGLQRGTEAEAKSDESKYKKQLFDFQKEQFEETKAQNVVSNFLANKKINVDLKNALKPQLSSFTKSLISAGIEPSSPQGIAMLEAELKKAANTITLDNRAETEEAKVRGKHAGEKLNKMEDDAESAYTNLQNYEMITNLLPSFETGALSEGAIGVSKIAKRFGLDITFGQDVAAGEAIRSLTGSLVMDTLAKFKGAISDGERAFAKEINLGLGLSRKGNEMLIDINSRIYNRQIKKADLALEWEDKYGSLRKKDAKGNSWNTFWKDYIDKNPLFDEEFKKQIVSQSNVRDEKYTDGIQIIPNSDGVDEEYIMNNGQLYKIKKVETN
ncbi:hypothetical protein [uncultured Mediterranean phage]|nr:hypothetical protein [uncultured Mediterranean phage]